VLRTLRTDAKEKAKVRTRLAREAQRLDDLRAKNKWGKLVWHYFWCTDQALHAGMRDEALDLLRRLNEECERSRGGRFDGVLSSFREFGRMEDLIPEIDRLRRFYGAYYTFLDETLGTAGVRYAGDIAFEIVKNPQATTKRGTELLIVRRVVSSQVFRGGGTLIIGPGWARLFGYPQPAVLTDAGAVRPKTVTFLSVIPEGFELRWAPADLGQPVLFAGRLPDMPVTRIDTRDGLFDLFAPGKEEATLTGGWIRQDNESPEPAIHVEVRAVVVYGSGGDTRRLKRLQEGLAQVLAICKAGY